MCGSLLFCPSRVLQRLKWCFISSIYPCTLFFYRHSLESFYRLLHIHNMSHTYIYIYIYIYTQNKRNRFIWLHVCIVSLFSMSGFLINILKHGIIQWINKPIDICVSWNINCTYHAKGNWRHSLIYKMTLSHDTNYLNFLCNDALYSLFNKYMYNLLSHACVSIRIP